LGARSACTEGSFRGFFLGGAPEFERWVEAERDRLSRRYAGALERLAQAVEERGNHAAAVQWWGRLAEQSPYTSRVAVRLMRVLDVAGDRAGAIRHADQHAARLRADLDAVPDPDVATLAAQLRSQPTVRVPPPIVPTPPLPFPSRVAAVAHAARPRLVARLPALIAGLLLLGLGWWAIHAAGAGARPLRRRAVLPLADNTGDSTQQYLVEGVHEAVITELAQIRDLSVVSRSSVMRYRGTAKSVPEIARELNVDALVEGRCSGPRTAFASPCSSSTPAVTAISGPAHSRMICPTCCPCRARRRGHRPRRAGDAHVGRDRAVGRRTPAEP
jgi:hypothetical protein